MASSFYGCKGGSFLFSARIVKANERGRMRRLGGGEGTFLQKGSLSPSPSQDFHAYRIPACRLSRWRREGQSAGCRKKPGNEKPGMASIPGFRNCPGGGTQGRDEPQHDIVGRFHVRMASASGRKIWEKRLRNASSHVFSRGSRGKVWGGSIRKEALPKRISYSPFTTSILRAAGFSGSLRGISMLNTPSLWVAVILSVSTSSGRESTRRNEPYERSIR